ncbi:MAG: M20 family peptidase [Salinivenus sp.]
MRFSLRHIGFVCGGLLVVFALVILGKALTVDNRQVAAGSSSTVAVDSAAVGRLAEALQFRTVTKRDPAALDSAAYEAFYETLEEAFPRVHTELDTTHVNGLSRLYTWEGTDSTRAPVVLMGHADVVPIESDSAWTHPPFSGTVSDGYVWGRGALDDKASVVGILEAVSTLLARDEQPARTIHIAIGHDEEVGGARGAQAISEQVIDAGPDPALVVDEGGAITEGALPGLDRPLAVVGVAEKGYLSVELRATGEGGHSSAPPEETSIETLNQALSRLLDDPPPARLDGVMGRTLDFVAPQMSLPMRAALGNRWLTAPAVRWALNQEPATRAAIRTVQVPTRLSAGVKDNVIPTSARATVNYRILPSHSVDQVRQHIESTIGDLPVEVTAGQTSPPTPVSAMEDSTFRLMQRTVRQVTSDSVVVAPYLVPGATDSRYYAESTEHVYRFLPYTLRPADRGRIHGVDERISVEDYKTVVRYYAALIQNAEALPASTGN